MRGFPLVSLLITGAVLVLVGLWPLRKATTAAAVAPEPARSIAANAATLPSWLSLRFAHVPESVRIRQGGEVVAECAGDWSGSIPLSVVEGVAELEVSATWPPGTGDTVVEVRIEPDGLPSRTENIWSEGEEASDLIQFLWTSPP